RRPDRVLRRDRPRRDLRHSRQPRAPRRRRPAGAGGIPDRRRRGGAAGDGRRGAARNKGETVTSTDRSTAVAATAAPRVAVIILTWNRVDDIVMCLESFADVHYPNLEVVVVDNASADDTVEVVRERYPWATLIVNDDNLGYVGGNNVGIRYALAHGADYVFILNSDTKMTPTCLTELVRIMQSDPHIAITGAKNLYMQNPAFTWGKYGVLNWGPMLVRTHGRFVRDYPEASPKDVDWVIGNGCMMSREALETVGIFDEEFFQVNEDVDWCVRARKLGYRVVYV